MTAMFHRFWIVLDNARSGVVRRAPRRRPFGTRIRDRRLALQRPAAAADGDGAPALLAVRQSGSRLPVRQRLPSSPCSPYAIWALLRSLTVGIRRCALLVAAVIPSGVLFFNAVYVWPKLIAATLVVAAFAIVIDGATRSRILSCVRFSSQCSRYLRDAVARVFGLSAPCVGPVRRRIAFVYRRCRWSLGLLLALVAAVLVLYAPWSAFQRFEDPPGNRLVKWHLADSYKVDDPRSIADTVIDAYSHATIGEIVVNKLENFGTVIWRPTMRRWQGRRAG